MTVPFIALSHCLSQKNLASSDFTSRETFPFLDWRSRKVTLQKSVDMKREVIVDQTLHTPGSVKLILIGVYDDLGE